MKIVKLSVDNYKSLKGFEMSPEQLSVLVGANASGKSNFADCLHFLSEAYRLGLEIAVARKGGYDNIVFRAHGKQKEPIHIAVTVELDHSDTDYFSDLWDNFAGVRVEHSFSFAASKQLIQSSIHILDEVLTISISEAETKEEFQHLASIVRKGSDIRVDISNIARRSKFLSELEILTYVFKDSREVPRTELLTTYTRSLHPFISIYVSTIYRIGVFQLNPMRTRESGVTGPELELDRHGENLPAVVKGLQDHYHEEWEAIEDAMRVILPDLMNIHVVQGSRGALELYFQEFGFTRPWNITEVSDGTVQALALLTAVYSPVSSPLVIEEPENSVHPWIVRKILEACREASRYKQIVVTTHSPIVMNQARPDEIWVIWRAEGFSRISRLVSLDSDFLKGWQEGDFSAFDFIDSGIVRETVPPFPSNKKLSEEE